MPDAAFELRTEDMQHEFGVLARELDVVFLGRPDPGVMRRRPTKATVRLVVVDVADRQGEELDHLVDLQTDLMFRVVITLLGDRPERSAVEERRDQRADRVEQALDEGTSFGIARLRPVKRDLRRAHDAFDKRVGEFRAVVAEDVARLDHPNPRRLRPDEVGNVPLVGHDHADGRRCRNGVRVDARPERKNVACGNINCRHEPDALTDHRLFVRWRKDVPHPGFNEEGHEIDVPEVDLDALANEQRGDATSLRHPEALERRGTTVAAVPFVELVEFRDHSLELVAGDLQERRGALCIHLLQCCQISR
ncbi:hypothetical protein D3C87_1371820 [compost metagenome]